MSIRFAHAALAVLLSATAFSTLAQSPDSSGFTLHTQARVVVTDVTVTEANGNPVHHLSRSAFHIFDEKKPQNIASFEEHTSAQPAIIPTTAPAAPHIFSNDFLLHPPPVFNVIVLDTVTIDVVTQMYLYQQLTDFINTLPPQNSLAIFVHSGEFTLLLQDFTTDHALLHSAIRKAIPVLPMPGAWYENRRYYGSFQAMQQIAVYLGQLPGRKNVLWYSAGAGLFFSADANKLLPFLDPLVVRAVYDQLEAGRIALYPIDVRGPNFDGMYHLLLDDEAKATGGRAIYNNNALADASSKIIAADADFYTLSYSPRDFKQDNKWHNVKVTLDGGPYTLSYRTGYYGDGANGSDPNEAKKARILLTSNGEKFKRPGNYDQLIIFQAEVQPSSAVSLPEDTPTLPEKKNETIYNIRYAVPAADFVPENIPGGQRVQIGAGAIALNQNGRPVGRVSQKFTLSFDGDKLTKGPNGKIYFDQQFSLPKGQNYLFVAVWDTLGGRLGTVQVPLDVPKRVEASHDQTSQPKP
ncbi:VWA domain-containing protein [Tunturiibacter psychrotolerans]|uniref:VWA domain-containing protein n=1 Tax=Tunturiibacter psychrotolerans TaxID=3069686 RepID=UPI003D21873E